VEQLTVLTHTAGECMVLALVGELDVTNADEVEEAVRIAWQDPSSYLVFDLSGLMFMDSAGVRVLVRTRRRATEHAGTVVLAGPTSSVSRIIEITGLDQVFTVKATLDEALPAGSISDGDDH
jgi:anti-anti-sigma factor